MAIALAQSASLTVISLVLVRGTSLYLPFGPRHTVGGKSSAGLKKIENKLVPGLNPPSGDMRNFLEQQRRLYGV